MNGRNFARQRARMLNSGRPERTIRKAIAHLAREAGAQPVYVDGRLVAHVMPDGFTACELRRYRSERAAIEELANVEAFRPVHGDKRVPVRHFHCVHCRGFHLTSRR